MKTAKSQMIERLVRMSRIGLRIGNVTSRNTRHGRAPSISAASTSSSGTCASAAYDVIATNGIAPHTITAVTMLELRERRRVPVVVVEVAELELRQDVVEDAVLVVRDPVPDLHGDDDGHRPDEHERRRQQDPHASR